MEKTQQLNTVKYAINNLELDILIDYENETVWLTTDQIAELFSKSRSVVSKHIKNIITENYSVETSVCAYFAQVATDGKTYNIKHYNLEIVILLGNKIDPTTTKEFKEFIEENIKEYKKTHKRLEIVKFIDNSLENSLELDVNVDPYEETVWLNLNQISILFERDKSVISRHINKIFEERELEEDSVVAFFATTEGDGKIYNVKYFNLDVILSVGYRVKSKRGTMFRKWASKILKEYLVEGFAVNKEIFESYRRKIRNLVKMIKTLNLLNIEC